MRQLLHVLGLKEVGDLGGRLAGEEVEAAAEGGGRGDRLPLGAEAGKASGQQLRLGAGRQRAEGRGGRGVVSSGGAPRRELGGESRHGARGGQIAGQHDQEGGEDDGAGDHQGPGPLGALEGVAPSRPQRGAHDRDVVAAVAVHHEELGQQAPHRDDLRLGQAGIEHGHDPELLDHEVVAGEAVVAAGDDGGRLAGRGQGRRVRVAGHRLVLVLVLDRGGELALGMGLAPFGVHRDEDAAASGAEQLRQEQGALLG